MGEQDLATARIDALIRAQSGCISRRQILECGGDRALLRRRLRRKELVPVYSGVYVAHTGALTWEQEAWAAILHAVPAVLVGESAIYAITGGEHGRAHPIHIAVDEHRNITRVSGVVVHYRRDLSSTAHLDKHPPRTRPEATIIDLADNAPTRLRAIAQLSIGVQARITTARRMLDELDRRTRTRRGEFLRAVLHDVQTGVCSVLEYYYAKLVERAHGLPTPRRQTPTGVGRPGFRDVDYEEYRLVVELDGRLGHVDPVSRDLDLERDLDAAAHANRRTVRLGWGQVLERMCTTAYKLAMIMAAQGWRGTPRPCRRPDCTLRSWPARESA